MTDNKKAPTDGIIAGHLDLEKPAKDLLLEIAEALKQEAFGNHMMLTLVDIEEDPDCENPYFISMYLSPPEEIQQAADHEVFYDESFDLSTLNEKPKVH